METHITRYEEVLSKPRLTKCLGFINDGAWKFEGYSLTNDKPNFWRMELMHEQLFSKIIFDDIKTLTKRDFVLDQCYANGQTYGQDGAFHFDGPSGIHEDQWTFLLYLTNTSGNTEIKNNIENGLISIKPCLNTAVMFPQGLLHRGLAPTRDSRDLRITVAFKMTEIIDLPF
jgi:hypothetical protein